MSNANLITIAEAGEKLGVTRASFHTKGRGEYWEHVVRTEGSKILLFDINGYERKIAGRENIVAVTGLLVEYLFHEEGMTYTDMSKMSKVSTSNIQTLNFGWKNAFKIARSIATQRPFHFERFHKSYKYPYKKQKRKRLEFTHTKNMKNIREKINNMTDEQLKNNIPKMDTQDTVCERI